VVKLITAAVDCGVSPGERTCVSVSHADWRALRHSMHDQGLGPADSPSQGPQWLNSMFAL
jgi:hypothetical protein